MSQSKSVHILTGMDAIINPSNIKPGMSTYDLKELEQSMIKGGLIQHKSKDPSSKLDDELRAAAEKLNIKFGDTKPVNTNNTSANMFPSTPMNNSVGITASSLTSMSQTSHNNHSNYNNINNNTNNDNEESENEDNDSNDEGNDYDNDEESSSEEEESPQLPPIQSNQYSSQPLRSGTYDNSLQGRTQEQQRRSHIDTIVGTSDGMSNFSIENEKREDLKCAMLSEIDILWGALEEADVDLSRIPRVDRKSDFNDVDAVLKMLRHKNDHSNYVSLAEELMLGASYILESVFDGERTYFGKYRPNLTGYSNVLLTKFRRFRVENSQIVSGIMHDYNIGPGARIAMELIPSILSYSSLKSAQHNEPGLYTELDMQKTNQHLRDTIK